MRALVPAVLAFTALAVAVWLLSAGGGGTPAPAAHPPGLSIAPLASPARPAGSADARRSLAASPIVTDALTTRPGGDEGTLWLPYTLQGDGVLPTYGTSVAVDARGGIHVAYAIFAGSDRRNRPATYAYCAAHCASAANWRMTQLGTTVQDVRLALDPDGHPRLMLFGPKPDPATNSRSQYQYAACDTRCTDSAGWTLTTIATPIEPTALREYNNNRYFALDRQGHPAFVYTDTSDNEHPGTFYMSCQGGCTRAANWTETALSSTDLFDNMSLTFSPAGGPRLALGIFNRDTVALYLAYAECDRDCSDVDQWTATLLAVIHGTGRYALQSDRLGRPRLALYSGSYAAQPFADHMLYYLWCDQDCGQSAEPWMFTDIGLPWGAGSEVDMLLDARDRPRLSYQGQAGGLDYAWCDAQCESGGATWRSMQVESKAALADDFEVLPVRTCTVSTWLNGQRTSLALDAAGNPRIAYDAEHWWFGVETSGGTTRDCGFKDVTVTRFALFDQR